MFTVLHRENGIETIHTAVGVCYRGPFALGPSPSIDLMRSRDDLPLLIDSGDVFVMNEQGATVAKYVLGSGPKAAVGAGAGSAGLGSISIGQLAA